MDTQTVFKVAFIIFVLHLILQHISVQNKPTENFGTSLDSDTNSELAQSRLENNISRQADEDFINDLINSGVNNDMIDNFKYQVAPAPSGAPSFDDLQFNNVQNAPASYPKDLSLSVTHGKPPISNYDLSKSPTDCKINKLEYQQHAESDMTLAQVINNQLNSSNEPVQPGNNFGEEYVSAHFGDTSITPFNRSHGLSTNEFYTKNKVSHFNSINSGLGEFPTSGVLSGPSSIKETKSDMGFASIKKSKQPVQVDSKIYSNANQKTTQYSCGGVMGDMMAANAQDNFSSLV